MLNKRKLHHYGRVFRHLNHWHFLVLTIVFGVIFIFTFRGNNLKAIELRDNVLKVDQENGDVEAALNQLREHVYAHMNANLATDTSVYPPIQLKYRYERLVAAEKERVDKASASIYTDAQRVCEAQNPAGFSGSNRVACIENYVTTHGTQPKHIEDSLYKFDFASPTWSPDLAGWSLLATLAAGLLALASFTLNWWLKEVLSEHQ